MKKRITSVILVIIVILSPVMFVNAESDEHTHSENCVYSCELDKIDTAIFEPKSQNVSTHIDHPGSEKCIYSCVLENIDGATPDFHAEQINEEEFQKILDAHIQKILDEYRQSIDKQESSCTHYFFGDCVNDHDMLSDCYAFCRQTVKCAFCSESYPYATFHETHSWSSGWCGKTCRNCGIIQLSHPPGGCWYCS